MIKPYYDKGGITIYNADCLDILPHLPKVDLVFTDPPYKQTGMGGGGFGGHKFYQNFDDKLNNFNLNKYQKVLLKASDYLIAFHCRNLIYDYAALAKNYNLFYDLHIWYKNNAIPFTNNTWKSDVEYISLMWSKKPGWARLNQREYSKVYLGNINTDNFHPTAKPIELLKKYIKVLEATTILDPFMGSGTTLRAAKDLGRRAIGIEICEDYCRVAVKRLSQEVFNFNK